MGLPFKCYYYQKQAMFADFVSSCNWGAGEASLLDSLVAVAEVTGDTICIGGATTFSGQQWELVTGTTMHWELAISNRN